MTTRRADERTHRYTSAVSELLKTADTQALSLTTAQYHRYPCLGRSYHQVRPHQCLFDQGWARSGSCRRRPLADRGPALCPLGPGWALVDNYPVWRKP